MQEYADLNETSTVYKKICQIAKNFKPRTCGIKTDDSTVVWDSRGILDSWKTNCEWL